jgi:hypothetical protein
MVAVHPGALAPGPDVTDKKAQWLFTVRNVNWVEGSGKVAAGTEPKGKQNWQ